MKYREVLEEIWDNWLKEPRERKKYSIHNKDYAPLNVKKEEYWGRDIPADWEHFKLSVLHKGGYFDIVDFNDGCTPLHYCVWDFEDLAIVAYDDLEKPRPLSLKLIESDKWQLREI